MCQSHFEIFRLIIIIILHCTSIFIGALNLTREAGENSRKVYLIEKNTTALLNEADRQCRRTENFLTKDNTSFVNAERRNEDSKLIIEFDISQLEKKIPDLNEKVYFFLNMEQRCNFYKVDVTVIEHNVKIFHFKSRKFLLVLKKYIKNSFLKFINKGLRIFHINFGFVLHR